MRDAPAEIRLVSWLVCGGALVFLAAGVLRWNADGDAGWIRFPTVTAVLALVVCAGLIAGFRPARPAGMVLVSLLALVHLLIVLGAGPWWTRLISGVLSAAHVYAFVLLNTGPVRRHLGGAQ